MCACTHTRVHTQITATAERAGKGRTLRAELGPEREVKGGPQHRTETPTGADSNPDQPWDPGGAINIPQDAISSSVQGETKRQKELLWGSNNTAPVKTFDHQSYM